LQHVEKEPAEPAQNASAQNLGRFHHSLVIATVTWFQSALPEVSSCFVNCNIHIISECTSRSFHHSLLIATFIWFIYLDINATFI
jgi:hypothetical protein